MKRNLPGRTISDFFIALISAPEAWTGDIEHVFSSGVFPFNSLEEMIFILHDCLENAGHPQTTTAMRSWSAADGEGESGKRSDDRLAKTGSKSQRQRRSGAPTFFIRIHFRQNATWQGSIQWLEWGGIRQFRSMLEMIMLMKEAVDMSGGSEIILSSWEDEEEDLSLLIHHLDI